MNNRNNHLPVNWIDGMKISKNHFLQSENNIQETIINSRNIFINDFNFGLISNLDNPYGPFVLLDENTIKSVDITLKICYAITRGGAVIDINNHNQQRVHISSVIENSKNDVKEWDLIVYVNPFSKVPVGEPDINEYPPRHPFTEPKYSLEVLPRNQVNRNALGLHQLVIGRINLIEGELILDSEFIPPCSSLDSYPVLMKAFENAGITFQNLYNLSLKVLKKIQEKNKHSNIAKNVKLLCDGILGFYGNYYFKLRNVIPHQSPIFFIEAYSILANIYQGILFSLSSEEKEELMKYQFEWCDIKPGDFENILTNAVKIKYDHNDISDSVDKIQQLLKTVLLVFTRMDSLEFIGQKKESMVVTKEVVLQQVEQPKKRWSILD